MDDHDVLTALGASAIDSGAFEQDFVQKLEECFDSDQEEGECSPEDENSNEVSIDQKDVNGDNAGVEDDSGIGEVESSSSNHIPVVSDILRNALLRPVPPANGDTEAGAVKTQFTAPKPLASKTRPKPSSAILLESTEKKETAEEMKIRQGEMTPFGTVIARSEGGPKASFLDFSKYLSAQQEFSAQKRKQNRKLKKNSNLDNEDSSSPQSQVKATMNPKASKRKPHDPFKNMFPKKRRLEKVGSSTTSGPGFSKNMPRLLPSESNSMYVNPEEDSDYEPPDNNDSDDNWEPEDGNKRTQSGRKTVRKRKTYKEVDTDDSLSEDEEERKVSTRKLRKEADDGDYKFFQQRVQAWKQHEIRFTGDFHNLSGGFKIPQHIWESLYDYQKVGVSWLWELHQKNCGGVLGDEMGLGKTIQIITFLSGLSCSNILFRFTPFRGLGPSIIVCPATIMHQWVKEFHTWWPPFRVVVLHDSGSYTGTRTGLIRSVAETNGILITSYVGIVNSLPEILKHSWHYVILDEGHKIRNPDAHATLAVKQIPTAHRLILSGSPLQNNLRELWSLFDFVFPGKLGTLPAFMEQFAVPITQGGYANASEIQVAAAYKCASVLRDIINPYLLRRMKTDVKDHVNLPPKSEQVLFCKMTNEQKACYINYLQSKEIESVVQGRYNLFAGLINLRKICNHPHLFDGGPKLLKVTKQRKKKRKVESSKVSSSSDPLNLPSSYRSLKAEVSDHEDDLVSESDSDLDLDPNDAFGHWSKSGKMVVLETLLKMWHKQNHKVLLFSQSKQMLCILENFVRQHQYTYLRLDGTTTIGSRQPLIKKFNQDPSIFVFILTTKVGGLGLNLTGANRVIIFDPDWNPSTDLQARERAWRIGQDRRVTIYRLITSGTIEEKIYHRQIFKQFLTNRVLKDPKQKRFFKASDVIELFSFNEGHAAGASESEAIFAGTGSSIDFAALRKRRKALQEASKGSEKKNQSSSSSNTKEQVSELPREKSTGRLKGVPNLVKQRTNRQEDKKEDEDGEDHEAKKDEKQDDYVLRRLFRKSGVHAALKHDKIVDTNESDYLLVEKEAERIASDAVSVLKKSRQQCWAADAGRPTWTGNSGVINDQPPPPPPPSKKKLRMGPAVKKPAAAVSKPAPVDESLLYFKGTAESSEDNETMSSSDLIAAIRARKQSSQPIVGRPENQDASQGAMNHNEENSEGAAPEPNLDHVKNEHVEMLREIREFIAFRAQVDGQASTDELLQEFGNKLPKKESPLFKQMLGQLCSFRRVDNKGIWRLKPEFR